MTGKMGTFGPTGSVSVVTSPAWAVARSTAGHQRATFSGASTATVTSGARRRTCQSTSPWGSWSPW